MINGQNKEGVRIATEKILDRQVNLSQILSGHYFAEDVIRNLNNKQSFGLRSSDELDSILVFNVSKLCLYDYSRGRMNIIQCKDYTRLLNYLRFSVQSHRIYLNLEQACEFLRNKNIIP